MPIRYAVTVDSPGGADLSFQHVAGEELVPATVIADAVGRSFVVVSAQILTDAPDPDGWLFGSANARPAD